MSAPVIGPPRRAAGCARHGGGAEVRCWDEGLKALTASVTGPRWKEEDTQNDWPQLYGSRKGRGSGQPDWLLRRAVGGSCIVGHDDWQYLVPEAGGTVWRRGWWGRGWKAGCRLWRSDPLGPREDEAVVRLALVKSS